MYSFYGGRPGNSFVIITTYKSVADMVAKFKLGPAYTAVHYDEHVMINTDNKNDEENGRIYKRGYDFTNDMGGAQFIGTILGPAGLAPQLEIKTKGEVEKLFNDSGENEYRKSESSYTITDKSLVPGKYGTTNNPQFNDEIKWTCCSIRTGNNEDSTAYIGFQIPYLVNDFTASSDSAYTGASAQRTDDGSHPFYEKWNIKVPKGKKGDTLKNLRVIQANASDNVLPYDGQSDDNNNGRQILIYDYYNYDNNVNGDKQTIYLGDYNMIEDDGITIDDQGTITIKYTHSDDLEKTKLLKWIDEVTLNTETGRLTVYYNQKDDNTDERLTYAADLDWINSVDLQDDGTLTFGHTHNEDTSFDNTIKWIDDVRLANNGVLTVDYNNGDESYTSDPIKWISTIELTNHGALIIHYNTGTSETMSNPIKWIDGIDVANDGTVEVSYNTGIVDTLGNKIQWVDKLTLSSTGDVNIDYNTGTTATLDTKLNWLTKETAIDSEDGSVVFYWNDNTTTRVPRLFKWIKSSNILSDGTVQFIWNDNSIQSWPNQMRAISNVSVNTGSSEGSGNQKINIVWNNGNSVDIGNPINYVMAMAVNSQNHLLVRYSDPNRRAGGLTYNNLDGWTDLGQIFQQYEYNLGDIVSDLEWAGVGTITDFGDSNLKQKLYFTIAPTATIDPQVNNVTIGPSGGSYQVRSSNGQVIISQTNLTNSNTTIRKTLTGLQFVIETPLNSTSTSLESFAFISIKDMELVFDISNPQGG